MMAPLPTKRLRAAGVFLPSCAFFILPFPLFSRNGKLVIFIFPLLIFRRAPSYDGVIGPIGERVLTIAVFPHRVIAVTDASGMEP